MCLDLSDFLSVLAADAAPVFEVFDDPSSRGCLRIGCTVSAGGILMFVESIVAVLSLYLLRLFHERNGSEAIIPPPAA